MGMQDSPLHCLIQMGTRDNRGPPALGAPPHSVPRVLLLECRGQALLHLQAGRVRTPTQLTLRASEQHRPGLSLPHWEAPTFSYSLESTP